MKIKVISEKKKKLSKILSEFNFQTVKMQQETLKKKWEAVN